MRNLIGFLKDNQPLLLFGFVMMFFSSPGQTFFIALFSAEIRGDLGLSHGEFGAVYSLATLASAAVLLKTGRLVDQTELPKFALVVIFGLAVACAILANSTTIWMLFLALFLLRHLGQGLMYVTASTAMMRYARSAKAKANAISNMGYALAEASLPSLILLLLFTVSWRQSWLVIGLVMATLAPLLVTALLRGHSPRHAEYLHALETQQAHGDSGKAMENQRQWTRAEVLRDPFFYLVTPALLSQSLLYSGFMFHQIHLVSEKAWPLLLWGSLYALFSVVSITTSLLVGALADRVGALKLAPFVVLPMTIGLLALSSSNSTLVAAIFMACMGLSSGAQSALSAPFFSERYGTQHFGAIKSLASFAMVLMTAISPVLLGWLIDRGESIERLALGSACYAIAVMVVAIWATRTFSVEFRRQPT